MLFLPLVPPNKENSQLTFWDEVLELLGTLWEFLFRGVCLPYSSLVWSYPIYPQGMIGCLGLTPPLPPKATNSCYSIEWPCEVIS